ncbi:hypothetical protein EJ08DRAFT_660617 [Tothia fuscella]|uniref:Uncharacterized protein n=1 Tax=Tothia fuscella TaxID=1048955 RepID=A0A9P4NS73_9PEZI|nr:hypothetical protein EJ08DRAFT_660617 [Tothia fuscella]
MGHPPEKSAIPRAYENGRRDSMGQEQRTVPALGCLDIGAIKSSPTTDIGSRRREKTRNSKHNGHLNKEELAISPSAPGDITLHPGRVSSPDEGKIEESSMIGKVLGCAYTRHQFRFATLSPPITKQSLSELDIGSIIHNPKLRHDVNFDGELHFRPNLDGQKGQLKKDAQNGYWHGITAELTLCQHMGGPFPSEEASTQYRKDCFRRLPLMFETIKAILKHLVPDRDQAHVDEHLDVFIVLQEIEKGVCDIESIAEWLAQLLKTHCAPMRDEMVDRMVGMVRRGGPTSISNGLRELFAVLEAMKLDVANHQIRHLRALLIEDTINFERKYNINRIKRQRYNISYARSWYHSGKRSLERIPLIQDGSWPNRDVEAFLAALLDSLIPTTDSMPWPDTFVLDFDRLQMLKCEVQELMNEKAYCRVLCKLIEKKGIPSLVNNGSSPKILAELHNTVAHGTFSGLPSSNIVVELVRQALRLCGSSESYNAEWAGLAETLLHETLSDPNLLQKHAHSVRRELLRELQRNVERYLTSSPWDMFNALVAPTISTPPSILPPILPAGNVPSTRPNRQTEIVNRITHIAVIHWRVWEHLVYSDEATDESTTQGPATVQESKLFSHSAAPSDTASPSSGLIKSTRTTTSEIETQHPEPVNPDAMPAPM